MRPRKVLGCSLSIFAAPLGPSTRMFPLQAAMPIPAITRQPMKTILPTAMSPTQPFTSTDVLDARAYLSQADTNYYQSVYGYLDAVAGLDRAVGRRAEVGRRKAEIGNRKSEAQTGMDLRARKPTKRLCFSSKSLSPRDRRLLHGFSGTMACQGTKAWWHRFRW